MLRMQGWGCAWVREGVAEKVQLGLGRAWLGGAPLGAPMLISQKNNDEPKALVLFSAMLGEPG